MEAWDWLLYKDSLRNGEMTAAERAHSLRDAAEESNRAAISRLIAERHCCLAAIFIR
jgi:hypothetical protein